MCMITFVFFYKEIRKKQVLCIINNLLSLPTKITNYIFDWLVKLWLLSKFNYLLNASQVMWQKRLEKFLTEICKSGFTPTHSSIRSSKSALWSSFISCLQFVGHQLRTWSITSTFCLLFSKPTENFNNIPL